MHRYCPRFTSVAALLLLIAGLSVPAPAAAAYPHLAINAIKTAEQRSQLSPQQAAAKARAKYGGKVLKVMPDGRGYKVRLLLDSGRVITVTIRG